MKTCRTNQAFICYNNMKNIKAVVIGVSLFLLFYTIAPFFEGNYDLIFTMFMLGQILVLYMVYAVLKFGIAPKEKFSDGKWYDDVDRIYSKEA